MTSLAQHLAPVLQDTRSGSNQLVQKSLPLFRELLEQGSLPQLKQAGCLLIEQRGEFAALFHLVNDMLLIIEDSQQKTSVRLFDLLSRYEKQVNKVGEQIALKVKSYFNKKEITLLTHSHSSTVVDTLRSLADVKRDIHIIQTASHPGGEGKIQAKKLSSVGYTVTFITDTAFTPYLKELDGVILGADVVTENYIVNKMGSAPLARIAYHETVPTWVWCDKNKNMPAKLYKGRKKEFPTREVWEDPPRGITVKNNYFEKVPITYINYVATPDQVYLSNQMRATIQDINVAQALQNLRRKQ